MKLTVPSFFLILMLLPGSFVKAQPTKTEKQRFELAFAISTATSARYGAFKLPGEYVFGKDNKLVGQKFTSSSFTTRFTVSNEGIAQLNNVGTPVMGVAMKKNDCNTENVRFDAYDYKFNSQEQVIRMEEKTYSRSRGGFQKRFYTLEYNNNGIAKVSVYMMVAEGQNALTAKPVFEYITDLVTYDWKNNGKELTIVSVEYQDRKEAKDKELVRQTTETYYQIEKDRLFAKITINNKPETSKETLITPKGITIIASNLSYGSSVKTVYTMDDRKKVSREVVEDFNKDKLLDRRNEISYTYTLKDPSLSPDDNCNYTVSNKINIYDGAGSLVEERMDGKFRRKSADGTWTEWKFYGY